jgi:hypothetical protein
VAALAPVRGVGRREWIAGAAAFALALEVAAVATALVLHAVVPLAGRVPGTAVGAASLLFAVVVLLPLELPLSRWQVPGRWARYGHVCYSAAFGAALGPGVVTRLPSPSLLLLLAWSSMAPSWLLAVAPMAVFGWSRLSTTLTLVSASATRAAHPAEILAGWSHWLRRLPVLEAIALTAIGLCSLG